MRAHLSTCPQLPQKGSRWDGPWGDGEGGLGINVQTDIPHFALLAESSHEQTHSFPSVSGYGAEDKRMPWDDEENVFEQYREKDGRE